MQKALLQPQAEHILYIFSYSLDSKDFYAFLILLRNRQHDYLPRLTKCQGNGLIHVKGMR